MSAGEQGVVWRRGEGGPLEEAGPVLLVQRNSARHFYVKDGRTEERLASAQDEECFLCVQHSRTVCPLKLCSSPRLEDKEVVLGEAKGLTPSPSGRVKSTVKMRTC